MTDFLINELLIWFFATILLAIAGLYFFREKFSGKIYKIYRWLIGAVIIFRIGHALLKSIIQYRIWTGDNLSKLLLPPHTSISYFLIYVGGRFWLNILILIAIAFVFYLFLKFLKKHQERFFEEGEVELGFLAALISGWPNFAVFIPLIFIFVVLISIFRGIFLKEIYTTLGWPFILAALTTLILGNKLIEILNLGVLRI